MHYRDIKSLRKSGDKQLQVGLVGIENISLYNCLKYEQAISLIIG